METHNSDNSLLSKFGLLCSILPFYSEACKWGPLLKQLCTTTSGIYKNNYMAFVNLGKQSNTCHILISNSDVNYDEFLTIFESNPETINFVKLDLTINYKITLIKFNNVLEKYVKQMQEDSQVWICFHKLEISKELKQTKEFQRTHELLKQLDAQDSNGQPIIEYNCIKVIEKLDPLKKGQIKNINYPHEVLWAYDRMQTIANFPFKSYIPRVQLHWNYYQLFEDFIKGDLYADSDLYNEFKDNLKDLQIIYPYDIIITHANKIQRDEGYLDEHLDNIVMNFPNIISLSVILPKNRKKLLIYTNNPNIKNDFFNYILAFQTNLIKSKEQKSKSLKHFSFSNESSSQDTFCEFKDVNFFVKYLNDETIHTYHAEYLKINITTIHGINEHGHLAVAIENLLKFKNAVAVDWEHKMKLNLEGKRFINFEIDSFSNDIGNSSYLFLDLQDIHRASIYENAQILKHFINPEVIKLSVDSGNVAKLKNIKNATKWLQSGVRIIIEAKDCILDEYMLKMIKFLSDFKVIHLTLHTNAQNQLNKDFGKILKSMKSLQSFDLVLDDAKKTIEISVKGITKEILLQISGVFIKNDTKAIRRLNSIGKVKGGFKLFSENQYIF